MIINPIPTITLKHLKKRAELTQKVRNFFAKKNIIEVDVPILGEAPVTDPYLNALETKCQAYPNKTFYLQTSPEYFMKRLLSFGAPSIYYLGKSFRDDERGRLHSPEFTMLEWYHLGLDDYALVDEVIDVMHLVIEKKVQAEKITYKNLFIRHLNINPFDASTEALVKLVNQHIGKIQGISELSRDTALQLLMSEVIEPSLDKNIITVVMGFPKSQAALARLKIVEGVEVAARFEVYYQGIELANCYHELCDAKAQHARFEKDLQIRAQQGTKAVPIDQKLLAALEQKGLPDCAGAALGFDRLLMLALNQNRIDDIQSFGFNDLV